MRVSEHVAQLTWHGVDMLGTNTSVSMEVSLRPGEDQSRWALRATNHRPGEYSRVPARTLANPIAGRPNMSESHSERDARTRVPV